MSDNITDTAKPDGSSDPSLRRKQSLFILLAVVGAGIYWFSTWDSERHPNLIPSNVFPDFVIRDFTTHTYDEQGYLSYELSAEQLTHYEHSGEAFLLAPHFRVSATENQSGWHATADQGIAYSKVDGGRRITLQNSVKLSSDGPPESAYYINTDILDLYPDIQVARTQSPVTIQQATHRLDSVGILANWGQGELSLQDKVQSRYDIKGQ
jgi:lipopolysaccharide export system protein LptC